MAEAFPSTSQWTPITSHHRELLEKHYRLITYQLLPHMVLPYLVQNRVLDITEADMVMSERGILPQSSKILALVVRKSDQVFTKFVESLRLSNHEHIAQILDIPPPQEDVADIPMCVDTPGMDSAMQLWNGDPRVLDIQVSVRPRELSLSSAPSAPAVVSSVPAGGSSVPVVQAVSNPHVHGDSSLPQASSCPSPNCVCQEMEKDILYTFRQAHLHLQGLFPLQFEQDCRLATEYRQTIDQCCQLLIALRSCGAHVEDVLHACVLLRTRLDSIKQLDSLVTDIIRGKLGKQFNAAVHGLLTGPVDLTVRINTYQYLLYRQYIDSQSLDVLQSAYPKYLKEQDWEKALAVQLVQAYEERERQGRKTATQLSEWVESHSKLIDVLSNPESANTSGVRYLVQAAMSTAARVGSAMVSGGWLGGLVAGAAAAFGGPPLAATTDRWHTRVLADGLSKTIAGSKEEIKRAMDCIEIGEAVSRDVLMGLDYYSSISFVFARLLVNGNMLGKGGSLNIEHFVDLFGTLPEHHKVSNFMEYAKSITKEELSQIYREIEYIDKDIYIHQQILKTNMIFKKLSNMLTKHSASKKEVDEVCLALLSMKKDFDDMRIHGVLKMRTRYY